MLHYNHSTLRIIPSPCLQYCTTTGKQFSVRLPITIISGSYNGTSVLVFVTLPKPVPKYLVTSGFIKLPCMEEYFCNYPLKWVSQAHFLAKIDKLTPSDSKRLISFNCDFNTLKIFNLNFLLVHLSLFFRLAKAGQGILIKDPTIWLAGAWPTNAYIPPAFLGNRPGQLLGIPIPKNMFRVYKIVLKEIPLENAVHLQV